MVHSANMTQKPFISFLYSVCFSSLRTLRQPWNLTMFQHIQIQFIARWIPQYKNTQTHVYFGLFSIFPLKDVGSDRLWIWSHLRDLFWLCSIRISATSICGSISWGNMSMAVSTNWALKIARSFFRTTSLSSPPLGLCCVPWGGFQCEHSPGRLRTGRGWALNGSDQYCCCGWLWTLLCWKSVGWLYAGTLTGYAP